MDTDWRQIITEALQQALDQTEGAVAGAKLRTLVDRGAKERGLEFPPPEMRTFSSFVESFSQDFIVQRRPGQDVLVAPATRPELLAVQNDRAEAPAARLRTDLFEALTRIPHAGRGTAYYEVNEDRVQWFLERPADGVYVPLPQTTEDKEIAVRRAFAFGIDDVAAKEQLMASAESEFPLRDFTAALHATGLVMKWHNYRLTDLISRLKSWAAQNGLQWQSGWVEASDTKAVAARAASMTRNVSSSDLLRLVSALSERDIARINIPLDIVLRLVSKT